MHGLPFGNGLTAKTRRREELRGVILSRVPAEGGQMKDLRHPDREPPLGNLRILPFVAVAPRGQAPGAQDDTVVFFAPSRLCGGCCTPSAQMVADPAARVWNSAMTRKRLNGNGSRGQ